MKRGQQLSRYLLQRLGWQIEQEVQVLPQKYVLIAAPHTSNWDFVIGILARSALGLSINFVGKDSLFRGPWGVLFRWLGGHPVDRSRRSRYVDGVVRLFEQHEHFALCIAPEGTRKRVERLRTGFYYMALGARVPIFMAAFDWGHKVIRISPPFWPTGDWEQDHEVVEAFFRGVPGFHPEQGYGYPVNS